MAVQFMPYTKTPGKWGCNRLVLCLPDLHFGAGLCLLRGNTHGYQVVGSLGFICSEESVSLLSAEAKNRLAVALPENLITVDLQNLFILHN